jgi:hypothetical protein
MVHINNNLKFWSHPNIADRTQNGGKSYEIKKLSSPPSDLVRTIINSPCFFYHRLTLYHVAVTCPHFEYDPQC